MLYNFGVPRVDFIFNLFVFQMVLWCPMAPRPSIRGKAGGVWGWGRGGARGGYTFLARFPAISGENERKHGRQKTCSFFCEVSIFQDTKKTNDENTVLISFFL